MTSEHSTPVLEAAHIPPYADAGPHTLANGLLWRDLHRVFDRGREDFRNGRAYCKRHGSTIRLPTKPSDRPAPDLLAWQNETVFRG